MAASLRLSLARADWFIFVLVVLSLKLKENLALFEKVLVNFIKYLFTLLDFILS